MHRLWIALACGVDADDPDGGRYAVYMADANTALHRLTASGAVGTVTLNAEAVEERVAGSTGAKGGHDGEDQGRLRPLLQVGVGESCGNGVGERRLGWATIRYQKRPGPNCIAFIASIPSLIEH